MIIINDGTPDKTHEQKEVKESALKSFILDFCGKITESSFFVVECFYKEKNLGSECKAKNIYAISSYINKLSTCNILFTQSR